jgi:hypothetical protein
MDVAELAALLHETAQHHDTFEKAAPEHDWWDWYAPYLAARQAGSSSEEATRAADRYMAEVKQVAVAPKSAGAVVPADCGAGHGTDDGRRPFKAGVPCRSASAEAQTAPVTGTSRA